MPQQHYDADQWFTVGREANAKRYYEGLLDEGKTIVDAHRLAVAAFPDCKSFLNWLAFS